MAYSLIMCRIKENYHMGIITKDSLAGKAMRALISRNMHVSSYKTGTEEQDIRRVEQAISEMLGRERQGYSFRPEKELEQLF